MTTSDPRSEALGHLRERHALRGRVSYVGGPADSITEGAGASSLARSWWSRFGDHMAAGLGQPTGEIRSAPVTTSGHLPIWVHDGAEVMDIGLGLGMYGSMLKPGSSLTTTQACDRIRLLYSRRTDVFGAPGGQLEVRVDGVTLATLDCGGADVAGLSWDSGPLGEHRRRTVELACASGAFALADHIYFHHGDGDVGALFWNNAQSLCNGGAGMFGFADPLTTWSGAFTKAPFGHNPFNGAELRGGGSIEPDCFLCCTGTNDIIVFGNDRARLYEGYVGLIDCVRARCDTDPSIGIIVPTASSRHGGHYEHVLAASEQACRVQGAFLIDLWHDLGSHADDRDGFYHDGIHPNDAGHAAWARRVADWMLAAIAGPA